MTIASLLVLGLAGPVPAATWLGIDTNWNNTANWSGGAVPGDGDAVVIPKLATNPSMPAATYPAAGAFASFELQAGATNTCLGDTGVVNEASGGTVAVPHGIGVTINVSGNATIAGTINANESGFPPLKGPAPGDYNKGASYGGRGGYSGPVGYGSLTQPTALGSGGDSDKGGSAGGAIKLNVTGTLTLNGMITAVGAARWYGRPSGGSIWLIADTFQGNGIITADGGRCTTATPTTFGGGGGGRVAIEYATSTFTGKISVAGGISAENTRGQPGTLWEPKKFLGLAGSAASPVNVTITNGYQYYFTNAQPTNYWNLTVDKEWVEFHTGSLVIANLVLTNGASPIINRAILRFDMALSGTNDIASLAVTNSIELSDNSLLYLPAEGTYNLSGNLNIGSTNSVLYAFGNTGAVNTASGGTTNVPHGIGVTFNVNGDATIAGTINADGSGFPRAKGPGAGDYNKGASYGGRGGNGGSVGYGSLTQPTALGSGATTDSGHPGGGAIKLNVTGTLTLNGTITAIGPAGWYGRPSGGSIWLIADTFQGTGTVTAAGGRCTTANPTSHGGGGGGRIAIEYATSIFTGAVSVGGGTAATNTHGQTGIWFQCQSSFRGTYSTGGCDGVSLASAFSVSNNITGIKITRVVTRWGASKLAWSEQSTDIDSASLANTVNYTLAGLTPQIRYCIFTNDVFMRSERSSAAGMLTIGNFALSGVTNTIRVEIPPKGTILSVW